MVTASAAQGTITQGGSVGLSISATDHDDNASLTYTISGAPAGATLISAADAGGITYNAAQQSWTVATGALGDLTLAPGSGFSGQIDLAATVTNTEVNPNNSTDVATALASAAIEITVAKPTYSYATVDDPALPITFLTGINDAGQIVGFVEGHGDIYPHGFLYSGGTYTTIDDPLGAGGTSSSYTAPAGINNLGQVVGDLHTGSGDHGYLYSGGTYTTIDDPLATSSNTAYGINDNGEIVGYFRIGSALHGYLYSAGAFTTLDDPLATSDTGAFDINNQGQIVGGYSDGSGNHGYLYSGGTWTTLDDPLATSGTTAIHINNQGQIVGSYGDASGTHGFLYSGGTWTTINDPSATTATTPSSINDSGQIVGWYGDGKGFLATPSILTGTNGPDTFIFTAAFGKDRVADFNVTFDTIQFDHGQFADFAAVQTHAVQTGADTVITYDAADTVTLQGIALTDLHASNFLFV